MKTTTKEKYLIKNFCTPFLTEEVLKQLKMSKATWYRKVNATQGEKQGFEATELITIAKVLNRSLDELINQ